MTTEPAGLYRPLPPALTLMPNTLRSCDQETSTHSRRVVDLAVGLGVACGLGAAALTVVRNGARLHDIGKRALPASLLDKTSTLSSEDWRMLRLHPMIGARMLLEQGYAPEVAAVAHYHHERWDGAGYPARLAGEAAPLAARIVGIADAYDAMTSNRVYRPAIGIAAAQEVLLAERSKQFDPLLVDRLVWLISGKWV